MALAHELRHIWQLKNKPEYFSDYKPRDKVRSLEEYNLQMAEIDAHAFAALIMNEFFQISPLYENLSALVRKKILNRMNYIIEAHMHNESCL